MDNFEPYNVLLAIAINIAVLLMTAFGHKLQFFSAVFTHFQSFTHKSKNCMQNASQQNIINTSQKQ